MNTLSSEKASAAETFQGFEPLEASFVFCPNQFLDYCVQTQRRGVVRVAGYVLYQTLRWMDDDGRPVETEIPASVDDLVNNAGVSRGDVRPSLNASITGNFIACVQTPKPKSEGDAGRVGEYGVVWNDKFTEPSQEFKGFYAGDGRRTPVPHAFFTHVLPHETLAVIRVVSVVIRYTAGYQSKFGGRRKHAALSYSFLQQQTGFSRKTLANAIKIALEQGYIIATEQGRFDADHRKQVPTTYGLKWHHGATKQGVGSKRLPEKGTLSVQKGNQKDQFKKVTSIGSKSPPENQFKKLTSNKETEKELSKQQQNEVVAVTDESFVVLTDIGFDPVVARKLSSAHSLEQIRKQVEWMPLRNVHSNGLGLLRRAIEEDWCKPKTGLERPQKAVAREVNEGSRVGNQQREKRLKRREQQLTQWQQLSPKEQQQYKQTAIEEATTVLEMRHLQKMSFDTPTQSVLSVMDRTHSLAT